MTAPIIPGSTHKDDTRLQPMFPIDRLEMAVGYGFRLSCLPMVTFLCITPGSAAETRLMMSQLSPCTKPLLGKARLPLLHNLVSSNLLDHSNIYHCALQTTLPLIVWASISHHHLFL